MNGKTSNARLVVQRVGNDLLRIGLAGDWITHSHLPNFEPVEKGFAAARVKALEFETTAQPASAKRGSISAAIAESRAAKIIFGAPSGAAGETFIAATARGIGVFRRQRAASE